jgi:hypothetical protein
MWSEAGIMAKLERNSSLSSHAATLISIGHYKSLRVRASALLLLEINKNF